jgi:hypothetical protein
LNIVREHINEKFTLDSDPIWDLGIGGYSFGALKPKYILQAKEDMWVEGSTHRIKNKQTARTNYKIYKNNFFLIVTIENKGKIKSMKCLAHDNFEYSKLNKTKFANLTPEYLGSIGNVYTIKIGENLFNKKFKIIERQD